MNLNRSEKAVLVGIRRDQQRLASLDWNQPGISYHRLGAWRLPISEARSGLVRPNPGAWLGRAPTQADKMRLSRVCVKLEAIGLLERIHAGGTNRTTHLKLTPAGVALARELLAAETVTE